MKQIKNRQKYICYSANIFAGIFSLIILIIRSTYEGKDMQKPMAAVQADQGGWAEAPSL